MSTPRKKEWRRTAAWRVLRGYTGFLGVILFASMLISVINPPWAPPRPYNTVVDVVSWLGLSLLLLLPPRTLARKTRLLLLLLAAVGWVVTRTALNWWEKWPIQHLWLSASAAAAILIIPVCVACISIASERRRRPCSGPSSAHGSGSAGCSPSGSCHFSSADGTHPRTRSCRGSARRPTSCSPTRCSPSAALLSSARPLAHGGFAASDFARPGLPIPTRTDMARVRISPYQVEWAHRFADLGKGLRARLGDVAVRIDHIGSTAVPGMAAKPIIDIQISVADLEPLAAFQDPLEELGYVWRADNLDRTKRYFREAPGTPRTHIHVRRSGSWQEQSALLFRDYLRAHPNDADRYADLKRELAEKHRADRSSYSEAKGPFIWQLMPRADRWSQEVAWVPGPSDA